MNQIETYLGNTLIGSARNDAAGFFGFLLKSGLQLERGQGYWADKLYWMVKHNGEYICFVLINAVEDKTEPIGWVIWMGDSGLSRLAESISDERAKEVAWNHIDICGNCGGCENPGGSRKTLFGKEFDNVCITPLRFDNPDTETAECVKKLIGLMCGFSH